MMNVSDDLRLSEFYKYHIALAEESVSSQHKSQNGDSPNDSGQLRHDIGVQVTQVVSPDSTLTAFCQLAAIRLGVQRCGISLISRYQQYILAESTRTTNLSDTTQSDDPEDSLWLGMCECERHGNLCENTVALPSPLGSEVPPCFTVLDLRDSRFQKAPYVNSPPFMRFYCGTPISTDKGYNIGSLWVLDNRLLPEFSSHQKQCFGTIASLVMKQLVMTKENSERRKAMRMGQALSTFIDGTAPPTYAKIRGTANWSKDSHWNQTEQPSPRSPGANGHAGSGIDNIGALELNDRSPGHDETSTIQNGSHESFASLDLSTLEKAEPNTGQGQEERSALFARASFLMKDALEATGCVFLDTTLGSLAGLDESNRTGGLDQPGDETTSMNFTASVGSTPQNNGVQRKKHRMSGLLAAATQNIISAEVLGYAIDNRSSLGGSSGPAALGFTPLDEQFLLDLASNYPQGTLWSFEESGILYPAEEELPLHSFDQRPGERRPSTTCCREAEARLLRKHFPGVRQLLFVPLYDLNLGRSTAGCFAFSNGNFRVFAVESELSFMRSFINNIAAEISRMDTFAISSSKSNFIGSISHELRSPLHGVLAACEFLSETELSNYQRSLIETQISCGKTLLQVIEQVLDFSKINSFEKDESSARRHSSHVSSESLTSGPRMQNLFEQTDICELCEEVVEGSVAGAHLSATIGIESRGSSGSGQATDSAGKSVYGFTKNVAVILDFDYQPDWIYVVQPGALRRILMNVLGNSLKYTQAGCIRVRLSVRDMATRGSNSTDTITLSISDTGKGISKDFMRKRLFTPFNQEDHLSAGCGLGLSIVKSLTTTLNGTIEVRSEQDVGTTVSVNLPLSRGSRRTQPEKVTPARDRLMNNKFPLPSPDTTVGFIGFSVPETVDESIVVNRESKIKESIKASVSNCMVDWLQMNPIDADADINDADYVVILVDERLSDFIQPYVDDLEKKQPRVIALLPSEMSRREVEHTLSKSIRAFEVVSAPFGPRKMARAVSACEKTTSTSPQSRRPPRPSNMAPLYEVKADIEAGSDVLRAHGLTCNIPDSREAPRAESESPTLSPMSLPSQGHFHSGKGGRSPETTVAAQPMTNEPKPSSTTASEPANTASIDEQILPRTKPRLLLVDDNHINLRFLETFVKKRKPTCEYDCAEDGLQAVEAVERHEAGYSLVFMDLSMPVMGGLEATRKIRALEKERKNRLGKAAPDPALIVALTGLASSRDQANAFASGVNLFLTKPVKFKEIGKLLDDRFKD